LIDHRPARGKEKPVAIYELVADAWGIGDERRNLFARYAEGLAAYRAGAWRDAASAFEAALAIDATDAPSRMLVERCAEHDAHPPTAWDGVHVMTRK
jgi:adenylate cyclase